MRKIRCTVRDQKCYSIDTCTYVWNSSELVIARTTKGRAEDATEAPPAPHSSISSRSSSVSGIDTTAISCRVLPRRKQPYVIIALVEAIVSCTPMRHASEGACHLAHSAATVQPRAWLA
eukprot:7223-Heterococcus_DN1.PRE.1